MLAKKVFKTATEAWDAITECIEANKKLVKANVLLQHDVKELQRIVKLLTLRLRSLHKQDRRVTTELNSIFQHLNSKPKK